MHARWPRRSKARSRRGQWCGGDGLAMPGDSCDPLDCSPDKGIRLMPGPRRFGKSRHKISKEIRCKHNMLNAQNSSEITICLYWGIYKIFLYHCSQREEMCKIQFLKEMFSNCALLCHCAMVSPVICSITGK